MLCQIMAQLSKYVIDPSHRNQAVKKLLLNAEGSPGETRYYLVINR